jgi:hypothetical protein
LVVVVADIVVVTDVAYDLVSSLLCVRVDRAIALDIARERSAGVDFPNSR